MCVCRNVKIEKKGGRVSSQRIVGEKIVAIPLYPTHLDVVQTMTGRADDGSRRDPKRKKSRAGNQEMFVG